MQNPVIVYDKNGNGLQVQTDYQYQAALAMGYLPISAQTSKYPMMLYGSLTPTPVFDNRGQNLAPSIGPPGVFLVGNDSELAAALASGWSQTPGDPGGFVIMSPTVQAMVAATNAARSSRNGGKIPGW